MNAKELMIGDWVYVDGIATQVTQVNSDNEVWTNKNPFLPNDNVEPIQLTKELLDANYTTSIRLGNRTIRKFNEKQPHCLIDHGSAFYIGFVYEDKVYAFNRIEYVHEYQQALRQIGLRVLARSFRMK